MSGIARSLTSQIPSVKQMSMRSPNMMCCPSLWHINFLTILPRKIPYSRCFFHSTKHSVFPLPLNELWTSAMCYRSGAKSSWRRDDAVRISGSDQPMNSRSSNLLDTSAGSGGNRMESTQIIQSSDKFNNAAREVELTRFATEDYNFINESS